LGDYLSCAEAYHFYVPPNTDLFDLSFKTLALRRTVEYTVYDAAGQVQKKEAVVFAADPPANYTTWTFPAAPAQRGKLWRLEVSPPIPFVEQTYLKFRNVPPIVWTNPDAFFVPDEKVLRWRQRPAVQTVPYDGAGEGLRLDRGKPHLVARGEARGEGAYRNLDARQGTLEFWFRPEWAPDDIVDRTIAACGAMKLYRRSSIGTYLSLGGTRQSGLATQAGQWYHVAVTWDAGAAGREPKTQLYINGFEMSGTILSAARAPLGDWTGDTLRIAGDGACTIDDLRVSDVVRYTRDFAPGPLTASDGHTLVQESW